MNLSKRLGAEFLGTLWLVLIGCGSIVIGGSAIGMLGVALAFGLALATMSYAASHISGAHFNPAVSVGLWAAGRFSTSDLIPYIVIQVLGALAGAGLIYLIASGKGGWEMGNFAANGYGEHSPGGYSYQAAIITELVLSFLFVSIILGIASSGNATLGPLAIGLTFALIYLISIPVTGGAINPARSTSQAIFIGGAAINQLWVFWIVPIVGGGLAGALNKWCNCT